jgi:hypothetical protein
MRTRLILNIEYTENGTSREELNGLLQEMVDHAMNNGMITGETPAEVTNHNVTIEDPESTIHLTWGYEDVLDLAEEKNIKLTEDEAKEILAIIKRRHGASTGVNWDVISYHISEFRADH